MEFLQNLGTYWPVAAGIILVVLVVILLMCGYVKAPPDTAIIISGLRKAPRVLIGKAGVRIPFLERIDRLLLKQITIDIKTDDFIPTKDFINIQVDAVAKVRVGTDDANIALAMTNFLNKKANDIVTDLQDSFQGNLREIIGTMSLKEICNDRNKFGNEVQQSASVDMQKLGIEIISCNIQNITDRSGLIEDMGMDNTSKIKKEAAIAKAESDRDIAVAQAEADKQANDARVKAQTEIAQRNNELAIKQAELKIASDVKRAEADAAYAIQEQEQRKIIEVNATNADIAKQERLVDFGRAQVAVKEQTLAAEVKKRADADRYAATQKADVELYQRQKEAEAKRFEIAQQADAQKYQTVQEAEALKNKAEAEQFAAERHAEGLRKIGEAEADAIRAKAIAEAEGIDRKAEAMKKMGEASVLEMFFNAYPEVMAAAAKPLENTSSITMFGEGNSAKMVGDIVSSATQVMSGIEASTGINVQSLLAGFLGSKLATGDASSKAEPEETSESK